MVITASAPTTVAISRPRNWIRRGSPGELRSPESGAL
jgi:hypothetical protein